MDINKRKSILPLLIVSLLGFQSQCNKGFDCANNVYNFSMGIKAFPDNDSLHTGDTIWFEINEPTTLRDALTGTMIDYSNAANLSTAIGIAELISVDSFTIDANKHFKFLVAGGTEISRPDTNNFREFMLLEANNRYRLKFGIIPLKNGVYKLFVSSASNVFRGNDKCTKAGFGISFDSTDQHMYFNQIILPNVVLPPGGGIYLFKVIN